MIPVGKKIPSTNRSFCQEYLQHKVCPRLPKSVKHLFTQKAFRGDSEIVWSQRLFISKECATSEDRRMLPVLIINLDGVLGYWDDSKRFYYLLRPKVVDALIQLSYDFRIVAVSS